MERTLRYYRGIAWNLPEDIFPTVHNTFLKVYFYAFNNSDPANMALGLYGQQLMFDILQVSFTKCISCNLPKISCKCLIQ